MPLLSVTSFIQMIQHFSKDNRIKQWRHKKKVLILHFHFSNRILTETQTNPPIHTVLEFPREFKQN